MPSPFPLSLPLLTPPRAGRATQAPGGSTGPSGFTPNPLLLGLEPSAFVLKALSDVRIRRGRRSSPSPAQPAPSRVRWGEELTPHATGLTPRETTHTRLTQLRTPLPLRRRRSDLEQALLLLPFASALQLLACLAVWLESGVKVELSCQGTTMVLRLHQQQLAATPRCRATLLALRRHVRPALQGLKDIMGLNLAGCCALQCMLDERGSDKLL